MLKKRVYIFICLLSFAGITCKKEKLQPSNTAGPVVFYFKGNVNSMPVNIQAGINNYYMYSSYTQDVNNVYNFSGSLHQVSCTNCPNSIQFIINDYKATLPGNPATIDSSLVKGYYSYLTPSGGVPTSYSVSFTPRADSVTSYNWNFGDGATSTQTNPTHIYTRSGNYTVTLKVNNTCNDSITNPVNIGTPEATMTAKITVLSDSSGNNVYLQGSATGGTPPYTYTWNLGDSTTASNSLVYHHYISSGVHQVSLTITDSTGLKNWTNLDTNTYGSSANCIVNFSSVITPTPNPDAFSNVTVLYTDGNGDTYSSANVSTQPATTNFQVTSVSSYQNNENGQTTKMLHITFNCQLKDGSGNPMNIANGDAIIAVAYK